MDNNKDEHGYYRHESKCSGCSYLYQLSDAQRGQIERLTEALARSNERIASLLADIAAQETK